jgi:protein-S-isoprenylcysteine O-methyltransferase Ste14
VAAKITPLEDVLIITKPYVAHAVPNEREALLWQEARNSLVARWGRASVRVAVAFSVVVLAVLLFGPPSGTIGWIGTYLLPVGAMLGAVAAALALLMWALDRLPTSPYRDRWQ